jgi:hypothetical protein
MKNIKKPTQGGQPILTREDHRDYQVKGVQFIKDNKGSALFLDMGL